MPGSRRKPAPLPSKQDIQRFIEDSPGRVGKREIARAFHITGTDRPALNAMLRELGEAGVLERRRRRSVARRPPLPHVTVVEVVEVDSDGEVYARPLSWRHESPPPRILVVPDRRVRRAPGIGDRMLARLRRTDDATYEAEIMRMIGAAPLQVLGVYSMVGGQGRLQPADRRMRQDLVVAGADSLGASPGDLVLAEVSPGRRLGLRRARIKSKVGRLDETGAYSLISIHAHGIPTEFSAEALAQADAAEAPGRAARADLTALPLVTIDPDDARDFDDAVWASPDSDPANAGGWQVVVAIADVSHFVRPGSALDAAARSRGNSVYFPDRVVPMLPAALSEQLCSLKPGQQRPCLAVRMWFDATGQRRRHSFERATMRSAARLTYAEVQDARDGHSEAPSGLVESVIEPLYGAYGALRKARARREPLDIDLPERIVRLGPDGEVNSITPRPRFDSHRLIEEFMIHANVAAADSLNAAASSCMYRVHESPDAEKVAALRNLLARLGYRLGRGQALKPAHFNRILTQVRGTAHDHLINAVILRCQAQAAYSPANFGHFGLNLGRYAHFTSPIRRYADILVHRALISACRLGEGGLAAGEAETFEAIGAEISATERRAMAAERDALNRYMSAYMHNRLGDSFAGHISGVSRFGLFVSLDETGAEGIVPMRSLGSSAFRHDEAAHALVGRAGNRSLRLGDPVEVKLREAVPISGGLVFELVSDGARDHVGKARHAPRSSKGRKRSRGA